MKRPIGYMLFIALVENAWFVPASTSKEEESWMSYSFVNCSQVALLSKEKERQPAE